LVTKYEADQVLEERKQEADKVNQELSERIELGQRQRPLIENVPEQKVCIFDALDFGKTPDVDSLNDAVPDIPGDPFGSPGKGTPGCTMPRIEQIMQNSQEKLVKSRPDAKSIDELVLLNDDDEIEEFEQELRNKI
jgi:hypothetical protein